MLGHNIPKPVATGKIARDIREAVKQSYSQSIHVDNTEPQKRKYVIIWKQIMDCHFKVERLSDFSVLDSFECGVAQMDNFIHGNLKFCDSNHYCSTFVVRDSINDTIAALFSLSFDSVNLNSDDFEDLSIGAAGTDDLAVDETFRSIFEKKYSYPALEITYFAIDKNYRGQGLGRELIDVIVERAKTQDVAACLFLTVNALHTKEYSAVGFYEKCRFAKLSPVPQMDVWPLYKTIWVK